MSVLIYKNHQASTTIAIAGFIVIFIFFTISSLCVVADNMEDKLAKSRAVELISKYEDFKFRMIRLEKQQKEIMNFRTEVNNAYRKRRLHAESLNKQAKALIKSKNSKLKINFLLAYHQFCVSNSRAVDYSDRLIAKLASCQRSIKSLIESRKELANELNSVSPRVKRYRSISTVQKILKEYKNELNKRKMTISDSLTRAHIASMYHIKKAWKLYCGVRQKFFTRSRQLKPLSSSMDTLNLADRGSVANERVNKAIHF